MTGKRKNAIIIIDLVSNIHNIKTEINLIYSFEKIQFLKKTKQFSIVELKIRTTSSQYLKNKVKYKGNDITNICWQTKYENFMRKIYICLQKHNEQTEVYLPRKKRS